jgi:hypothetical protein
MTAARWTAHALGIVAAAAFIVFCTALPFLPGRYDSLAAPLSMMSQLFGVVGLLLVPVGVLWIVAEHWSRLARSRGVFAYIALIAVSLVWAIVSLGAFLDSLTLGVGVIALWAYVVTRVFSRLRALRGAPPRSATAMALYLVLVPIAVTLAQRALDGPLTDFSRSRAIRNSAALIADIERHRIANGRYPLSIVSVNKDYWPSVIGIRNYQYEPHGDAYNLFFEQITLQLGTVEVVMYNPLDQQVMTSHAMDVLQLTPEQLQLDRSRGHNAVHNARQPHWKYFWFD